MRWIKQFENFRNGDEYLESIIREFIGIDTDLIWEYIKDLEDNDDKLNTEFFKIESVDITAINDLSTITIAVLTTKGIIPKKDIYETQLITESPKWKPYIELTLEFKMKGQPSNDVKHHSKFTEFHDESQRKIIRGLNAIFKPMGYKTSSLSLERNYDKKYSYYLPLLKIGENYNKKIMDKCFPMMETNSTNETLIICDVQKSFKKFFTDMYINQLTKHCNNFKNVYQVWDNHHEGKNIDKDYLYDDNPEMPVSDEFYNFPNIKDRIEKRYNYNVDADFYKKILDKNVYNKVSSMEEKKELKKGDMFPTKEGTMIVYIGNNHVWYHCPKKLYDLLMSLKGKPVEIVGGSDSECLEDVFITAEKIGVIIKRNHKFIWSANHCHIK